MQKKTYLRVQQKSVPEISIRRIPQNKNKLNGQGTQLNKILIAMYQKLTWINWNFILGPMNHSCKQAVPKCGKIYESRMSVWKRKQITNVVYKVERMDDDKRYTG